jgi:tetratricopeptide (TPR) repeat protein
MKGSRVRRVAAGLVVAASLLAGFTHAAEPSPDRTAPLFQNLGNHHHRITTSSPPAQRYFNQGLILTFAFNHAEAVRSFREAARLDPNCAMCYWGVALALGPNINAPMSADEAREASSAAQQAIRLADRVSEPEKAYIQALATRYETEPSADRTALDNVYAAAMRQLVRRFPDDMDAAALFAEALMDTMPWHYWTEDGQPNPGTLEVLVTLESVMGRAPNHPLALHLYIHAVEASPDPKRGEAAADRLGSLVPGAGHLVHMPAHIYLRVGRYHDAANANERAAMADESYFAQSQMQGLYPAAYYAHNIHFLWQAASLEGRSAAAINAARKLVNVLPAERVREFPGVEQFLPTPLFALVQFRRWEEILSEPRPSDEFAYDRAMWHYARGLALAATGKPDEAREERRSLEQLADSDAMRRLETSLHAFPATRLTQIAGFTLEAELEGRQGRMGERLRHLEAAVAIEDGLPYMEPPYWYYPVRLTLGAALLQSGREQEAEAVFREDLREHPRNGWALYGLARSLEAQGSAKAAVDVRRQFEQVWKYSDVALTGSLVPRSLEPRRD